MDKVQKISDSEYIKQMNSVALSPQANYTD
jgi:hypothetical protein